LPVAADSSQPAVTDDFQIGDRVLVAGLKPGIIAFIGEVHFSSGDWAGVVLDSPTGKNDGRVGGHQYFMCEPKRGVFCRLGKLTKLPSGAAPAVESGTTARLEKNNSPNVHSVNKSDVVPASSSKVASPKIPAILVETPSSPIASNGEHHSDRGIPSPSVEVPLTNHSDGDDYLTSRFHHAVHFYLSHCYCIACDRL